MCRDATAYGRRGLAGFVEERVQCAECGNQYDSNENAFCPRCGSVPRARSGDAAAPPAATLRLSRLDPSLRRLRAAGLVLMILGSLAALQFLYVVAVAPGPDEQFLNDVSDLEPFASQPGGKISLYISGGAGNESIAATAPNGTVMAQTALENGKGWFNTTLATTFSNITITDSDHITRVLLRVYLPAGNDLDSTVDLATVDFEAEPTWLVADTSTVVRTLAGFATFMALVVVAGGLGAWRQRTRGLALLAGSLAVFPGLLVLPFQFLAGVLLLLPGAIALAFIIAGRRHFVRKDQS